MSRTAVRDKDSSVNHLCQLQYVADAGTYALTMRALCPGREMSSLSLSLLEYSLFPRRKLNIAASSLVRMVQSPLTNCPAVCGESAVGAVEEWLRLSNAKHLNTSKSL